MVRDDPATPQLYLLWSRVGKADNPEACAWRPFAPQMIFVNPGAIPDRLVDLARTDQKDPEDGAAPRAAVRQSVGDLTPKQRVLVALRYYENLAEAEIRSALDVALEALPANARAGLDRLGFSPRMPFAGLSSTEERP